MKGSHKWAFKARFRPHAYGWRGTALASQRLRGGGQRDQDRREVGSRPCRRGCRLADGAALACAGAHRYVLGRPRRRRPPHARRPDPDTDLGSGRRRNAKRMARTVVPRGHGRRRAVSRSRRGSVGRDRRLSRDHGGIRGAAARDDPAGVGREATRRVWVERPPGGHVVGTTICLSCLLEIGRYGDLIELLACAAAKWWHWHRFAAEALARTGMADAAIACAWLPHIAWQRRPAD